MKITFENHFRICLIISFLLMRKKSCHTYVMIQIIILIAFYSKKIAVFIQFFSILTYFITLRATLQGNYILCKYIITAVKPVIMSSV